MNSPLEDAKNKNPVINKTGEGIWTVIDILQWTAKYLGEKGSSTSRLDAEILLSNVLNCSRISLYTIFDKPLNASEKDAFKELVKRRAGGEPVAYITGKKSFWRHEFDVTPDVLIPRPETEFLVEATINLIKDEDKEKYFVLDIGTGSGCIAISLALFDPRVCVVAWDISEKALSIATQNAKKLGVTDRIIFKNKNVFDDESWKSTNKFDFILSNPPYVSEANKSSLHRSVLEFEPHLALFAKNNGLCFYENISRNARQCICSSGKILFEVGAGQCNDVINYLKSNHWNDCKVIKDFSGIERVVVARNC